MVTIPGIEDDASIVDDHEPSLSWEAPEIAGVAIVAGIALLALGGLGTGLAEATVSNGQFGDLNTTWEAVNVGAQWASPIVAIFVLAVFGLCWWQQQAWSDVVDGPDNDDDLSDAHGHLRRAARIAGMAAVLALITGIGTIIDFAAQVTDQRGGTVSRLDIFDGATMLATLTLLAGALLIGGQLRRNADTRAPVGAGTWPAPPDTVVE